MGSAMMYGELDARSGAECLEGIFFFLCLACGMGWDGRGGRGERERESGRGKGKMDRVVCLCKQGVMIG